MVTMPPLPHPIPPAEERSLEILASIRRAFAEKGFDGASMQDLARAAGMRAVSMASSAVMSVSMRRWALTCSSVSGSTVGPVIRAMSRWPSDSR